MNEIVKYGHPSLTIKCKSVTVFDKSLKTLADKMLEIMYLNKGVGLAAPQIGIDMNIFVYDAGNGANICINPKLISRKNKSVFHEGCLSLPGYYWEITRSDYVKITAQDLDGINKIHEGDELIGRVLQHEIDHLKGKILLSKLKRSERKEALMKIALNGFPGKDV
tara:strand:+ start:228 stop:722 length:495 start_codon:yes stop_codon:yes gene_type:complete